MFLLFFCLLVDKKSLLCNSFDYVALLPHLFSSTMTQKTALLCHYNLSLNASNGQWGEEEQAELPVSLTYFHTRSMAIDL